MRTTEPPFSAQFEPAGGYGAVASSEAELEARIRDELAVAVRQYVHWRRNTAAVRAAQWTLAVACGACVVLGLWGRALLAALLAVVVRTADARAWERFRSSVSLIRLTHPRSVNVLAIACTRSDRRTGQAAADALLALLPRLTARDRGLITDEGMEALLGMLARRTANVRLTVAVIRALREVGDARALEVVETLAAVPPTVGVFVAFMDRWFGAGMAAQCRAVGDAARESLPQLRARAKEERLRAMLLRPADESDDTDHLLRPVFAAPPSDDEGRLVRPADGPDSVRA